MLGILIDVGVLHYLDAIHNFFVDPLHEGMSYLYERVQPTVDFLILRLFARGCMLVEANRCYHPIYLSKGNRHNASTYQKMWRTSNSENYVSEG